MKISFLAFMTLLAPIFAGAQSSDPSASSRFDGAWTVRLDCPSNTEESAAKGYKYEFAATVKHGFISGRHGEEGAAGSLQIDGAIPGDGNAELRARGRTGNPEYAVKQPSPGSAYSYRIKAHFEETKGSGIRLEVRVCNFLFLRQ